MISRTALLRALRQTHPILRQTRAVPTKTTTCRQYASHTSLQSIRPLSFSNPNRVSSKSPADEKIEDITELYATAQDEFEIAMEETQKVSVYAEDDRKAAREELTRVQEAYKAVLDGEDRELAEEVKRRIGQRIRELENGVIAMEELALNQD